MKGYLLAAIRGSHTAGGGIDMSQTAEPGAVFDAHVNAEFVQKQRRRHDGDDDGCALRDPASARPGNNAPFASQSRWSCYSHALQPVMTRTPDV